MLPPLTDLVALLGIDLVLCAGCLRGLNGRSGVTRVGGPAKWITAMVFVVLWFPLGAAHLPILAYVRGISSDLSVTLVALAALDLSRRFFGLRAVGQQEWRTLSGVVACAALFLYPLALGWGDWDAYRAGWGTPGMWLALLTIALFCWAKGLRLLPVLVALALLAWSAGLLESTNLWDYLIDPWLATAALFQCIRWGVMQWLARFKRPASGPAPSSP